MTTRHQLPIKTTKNRVIIRQLEETIETDNNTHNSASTSTEVKHKNLINVETKNYYGILEQQDTDTPIIQDPPKKVKIPPIVVNENITNYKQFINTLKKKCKSDLNVKYKPSGPIIYTNSIEDHKTLSDSFIKLGVKFHTYSIQSQRPQMVVIRGLPNLDPDEITEELKSDFNVIKCTKMRQKAPEPHPYPLYLLQLQNSSDNMTEIYQLKYIQDTRIQIEKYKKSFGSTQCRNCQQYGHGTANCFKDPKCPRKQGDENVKCVNCGGSHPANYKGCPIYLERTVKITQGRPNNTTADVNISKSNSIKTVNLNTNNPNKRAPKIDTTASVDTSLMNFPPTTD